MMQCPMQWKSLKLAAGLLLLALSSFGRQDTEASLTIQFVGGSSSFQIGQVIPIYLSFRASAGETYLFSTSSYDRSGRLNSERFEVSPAGRDPLHNYYHDPLSGPFMMGGLFSVVYLRKEPRSLQENVNEWVVLDKPGRYTLRVSSGRVARRAEPANQPIVLTSNLLQFDVNYAGREWQEQTLAKARAQLDDPGASSEARAAGATALRFLDSPASVRELARQLTKPGDSETWDFTAGLLGARDQELVFRELEARLAVPDAAITQDYLWLLAHMTFARSHAALKPYPETDAEQQKKWLSDREELSGELTKTQDALYQRAADLIGVKRGAAKATTVATILLRPDGPHAATRLPEAEVASAFSGLTERQQATVLRLFWTHVKAPSMVRPLEAILDKDRIVNPELRVVALERLFDLDPEEGSARILAEIREPHADSLVNSTQLAACLGRLPNETLPDLDELLADRLERKNSPTEELDAQLIGRYATGSILSRVAAFYKSGAGAWDCAAEDEFLRYFLREDTEYGMIQFAVRGGVCTPESLSEVVRMKRWPEVEPVFIQRLDDSNLWTARDAAEVLGKYGGPEAKEAMLRRLRKFNRTWKSRGQELRQIPNMPREVGDAISFQNELIESLSHAQGWVLDPSEVLEIKNLALGEERESVR